MGEDRRFGRYRVVRTLGAGGMGEVYEAIDDALGREVAVKTLKNATGLSAQILDERFRHEARAIARLSHPNIVAVYDIDLAAEPPYLVMERVAGPSLAARVADGPLGSGELVPLGIQIARALAMAHAAGVVHRDVKPANVLGAGPGTWKLADFGVARVPDSSLTMTGQFVGSPAYAPPEALVKGVAAPAGDVYGLGASLYEAAAGRWPRGDASHAGALLAPVPPLRDLAPHVDADIAGVIDRALAMEPDARPSAAEFADALAGVPGHARTPIIARLARLSPRARWIAGGVGLALAIGIIAYAARSPSSKSAAADIIEPSSRPPPPGEDDDGDRPQRPDKHAEREWSKIADEVRKGHYEGARHKLDDWERRYGATEESRVLRDQLDALPHDEHRPRR